MRPPPLIDTDPIGGPPADGDTDCRMALQGQRHKLMGCKLSSALALGAALLMLTPGVATAASVCPRVPAAGHATCYAEQLVGKPAQPSTAAPTPAATAAAERPAGYHPSDLQAAYGLTSAALTDGGSQTVAIVDAYDDPNAASDLATYRSTFGLPACSTNCFHKVSQTGSSVLPTASAEWAEEISLDLDMVSAICPNCKILLVEAKSTALADLFAAEDYATSHANVVANTWGTPEFSSERSYDFHFQKSVPITFASGDAGYGVQYPAASPYVIAVGGTTLQRAGGSRGFTESAWSGAGSGCSAYEPKPAWQHDQGCGRRTVADVSADANPNTGMAAYDTYQKSGWMVLGGTSASSPMIAATYALASSSTSAAYGSLLYTTASSLSGVTGGSNGTCSSYLCNARGGYSGPTGLGSPNGIAGF